jgi:hypothetical protein
MKSKSRYIDNLKDLVAEYLTNNQNSNLRSQRGVLNFVGEVPRNYDRYINELEKEQKEFLLLAKEQMTIIKTTIISANSTLQKEN